MWQLISIGQASRAPSPSSLQFPANFNCYKLTATINYIFELSGPYWELISSLLHGFWKISLLNSWTFKWTALTSSFLNVYSHLFWNHKAVYTLNGSSSMHLKLITIIWSSLHQFWIISNLLPLFTIFSSCVHHIRELMLI